MVRLEKIAYQKIFNISLLGRQRKYSTPKKWNVVNPHEHMRLLAHQFLNTPIIKQFLKPIITFYNVIQRNFNRDLLLQQGLTFEDKFLHHDADLRRCNFFEHIARENLHPYHWILKVRRRQRYFKVQRTCRGFYVPQHVRQQAATQTYCDYQKVKREWDCFTHDNYWSDMTPTARRTVLPKLIPLQLPLNYGVLRPEAWDRYFFNEIDQGYATPQQIAHVKDRKRFPHDLTTPAGKRNFEEYVNNYNEKNPGIFAPEGQKFDFKKYYQEIGV